MASVDPQQLGEFTLISDIGEPGQRQVGGYLPALERCVPSKSATKTKSFSRLRCLLLKLELPNPIAVRLPSSP